MLVASIYLILQVGQIENKCRGAEFGQELGNFIAVEHENIVHLIEHACVNQQLAEFPYLLKSRLTRGEDS